MKYFILKHNKLFNNGPAIGDWKEVLNPAFICRDNFYRIPNNLVLPIKTTDNTIFPLILKFPYLMVSETMMNVIQMYGDDVLKKEVVLVDPLENLIKRYFLILLENVKSIDLKELDNHIPIIDVIQVGRPLTDRNIFETEINQKKVIIVNLEFAESILRRNALGVALDEVRVNEVPTKGKLP